MDTKPLSDRPWLLVPGTLCAGTVFDGFLDAMGVNAARRRYVTLDQPDVAAYRAIFADLAEDTVVCGFSLGAIVAAHAADVMTGHSLILFGLNPHKDDPNKAVGRHDLARDVLTIGGAAAMRTRLADVYGPTPDATRATICNMADATGQLIEQQTQLAITRPGALPALAKAHMPVLVLTGSHDHGAPAPQGRAAAQAAPNGRFHTLEGLGHFALLEDPTACAAAVCQMMDLCHENQ